MKQEKGTFWELTAKMTVEEANGVALQIPLLLQLIFDGEMIKIEK